MITEELADNPGTTPELHKFENPQRPGESIAPFFTPVVRESEALL